MTGDLRIPVSIAVRRQSKTPSVFVVASFTEPAWEPLELDVKPLASAESSKPDGDEDDAAQEYEFSRTFQALEGKHQYRFRLGSDNPTWFCDKDVDTGKSEHPLSFRVNHLLLRSDTLISPVANN